MHGPHRIEQIVARLALECRAPLTGNGAGLRSAQACVIGYFAKIASARLKALSIAASGAIPFFITSNSATLKTCSASTCAIAGL